jgi:MurNAc alpha-1-phosphate uridylyltransferase
MRPLTDGHRNPLLAVRGKPLMQWTMEGLQRGGIQQLVINTAWMRANPAALWPKRSKRQASSHAPFHLHKRGSTLAARLKLQADIVRALPLLEDVFWVAAGDVFVPEFVFAFDAHAHFKASPYLAHIWPRPHPEHNPQGDFGLSANGLALNLPKSAASASTDGMPRYTFSTIALYRRAFEAPWCGLPAGNPGVKAPLAPMLRAAMDHQMVSAELYLGPWTDVDTAALGGAEPLNPPAIVLPSFTHLDDLPSLYIP